MVTVITHMIMFTILMIRVTTIISALSVSMIMITVLLVTHTP